MFSRQGHGAPQPRESMHELLEKLQGGDLRSIGKAEEVIVAIGDDESLFDAVMQGMFMDDPVLRLRASDVCEKVSQSHPEWLVKHKAALIKHLTLFKAKEVRWHVAQMLARMSYTPKQLRTIVDTLKEWIKTEKSNIVKVFSMQTIYDLKKQYPELAADLTEVVEYLRQDKAPSVQSRLKRLKLIPRS
jgi:hypothetical protein